MYPHMDLTNEVLEGHKFLVGNSELPRVGFQAQSNPGCTCHGLNMHCGIESGTP